MTMLLAECFGSLLSVRLSCPRAGRKESTMKGSVFHPEDRVCFFAPWAILIFTLTLGILVAQRAAAAQQLVKVHCIGVLMYTT